MVNSDDMLMVVLLFEYVIRGLDLLPPPGGLMAIGRDAITWPGTPRPLLASESLEQRKLPSHHDGCPGQASFLFRMI